MKISFALHPLRPLTRSEAWGCFTANLALPGSGSLVAGRRIGYAQIAFAFLALGVSVVAALQSAVLYLNHGAELNQQNGDPMDNLLLLWQLVRWPLLGLALFVASLGWATITSMQILAGSPKTPHA